MTESFLDSFSTLIPAAAGVKLSAGAVDDGAVDDGPPDDGPLDEVDLDIVSFLMPTLAGERPSSGEPTGFVALASDVLMPVTNLHILLLRSFVFSVYLGRNAVYQN